MKIVSVIWNTEQKFFLAFLTSLRITFFLTFSTFTFIYVISSSVSSLFGFLPIMFHFSSPLSGLFGLTLRMLERLCSIFKCCLFFAPLTDLFGFLQIMFSLLFSTFTFIQFLSKMSFFSCHTAAFSLTMCYCLD